MVLVHSYFESCYCFINWTDWLHKQQIWQNYQGFSGLKLFTGYKWHFRSLINKVWVIVYQYSVNVFCCTKKTFHATQTKRAEFAIYFVKTKVHLFSGFPHHPRVFQGWIRVDTRWAAGAFVCACARGDYARVLRNYHAHCRGNLKTKTNVFEGQHLSFTRTMLNFCISCFFEPQMSSLQKKYPEKIAVVKKNPPTTWGLAQCFGISYDDDGSGLLCSTCVMTLYFYKKARKTYFHVSTLIFCNI